jgi:hypothetical protein
MQHELREAEDEPYRTAQSILEIDQYEANALFYRWDQSDRGLLTWKEWILKRLDGIIRDGEIKPWQEQMKESE